MTSAQIRQSFLDFFASKQHTIVPSSSLMPTAPNLLFDSGPIRTTAFATKTVPLPPLRLGRQTITIRATSGVGLSARTDAVTRTFMVVDTRLSAPRTGYVELPAAGGFDGGDGRTTVVISDASAGRYLPLLTDLASGGGARVDRALAAVIAQDILAASISGGQLQFQPGQGGADTEMQTRAEAGIGFDKAGGVKAGRRIPLPGVAVGGGQEQRHLIAAVEGVAHDLNILIGPTGEHVQRRVEAQNFLDRGFGV